MASHSSAASLPKGFRCRDSDSTLPKTPEPVAGYEDDMQRAPSPPRPRFKLKRRVASSLNAPTQQFLASVAAADVPIPTTEQPDRTISDDPMTDMIYSPLPQISGLKDGPVLRGRTFSPPKTPAPGAAPSLSPRRFPDWSTGSACNSAESTPECESSRPSTAKSTQTSASLFSRFSVTSEDLHCVDTEIVETGSSPKLAPRDLLDESLLDDSHDLTSRPLRKSRRAPWTKPMSDHLWATYLVYLQDPKITPVRFSKNGFPPHGVCLRVAREAKRSWRGAKPQERSRATSGRKSGSSTPTAESSASFVQWPHTCAATRAHLRELCRLKAASSGTRANQYLAHSPTPFGRTVTRFWNRRTTPTPSAFARDMNMSLAMSTSETMQPSGPLAQLTQATPAPSGVGEPTSTAEAPSSALDVPPMGRQRLASPFTAQSYGPSSSEALSGTVALGAERQTHTVGPRRSLQSPVRLSRSRSNTQKRRSRQTSVEPRRTKRPSLSSDFWIEPSTLSLPPKQPLQSKQDVEFSSSNSSRHHELFVPRTNLASLFSSPGHTRGHAYSQSADQTLGPISGPPPRLGSPFAISSASFSFPNRLVKPDIASSEAPRPFATVQQPSEGTTQAPSRNLADRLAYLDERLKELRHRDNGRRRSESPF